MNANDYSTVFWQWVFWTKDCPALTSSGTYGYLRWALAVARGDESRSYDEWYWADMSAQVKTSQTPEIICTLSQAKALEHLLRG